MRIRCFVALCVVAAIAATPSAFGATGFTLQPPPGKRHATLSRARLARAYGELPLSFVSNSGQIDSRVRYYAQAPGASFYFTSKQAVFSLIQGKSLQQSATRPNERRALRGAAIALRFLGGDPRVAPQARERLPGKVNYLVGADPARWHRGLSTYAQVVYRNLWPGVDLVFRGAGGRLKYELHVAPGASVSDIRLAYAGVSGLALDPSGNLVLRTPLGALEDSRPVSYQQLGGRRGPVASRAGCGFGFRKRERTAVFPAGHSTLPGGRSCKLSRRSRNSTRSRAPRRRRQPSRCRSSCSSGPPLRAGASPRVDHLDDRTIAAAGLSGHGYKFSCVLGAIVGELALGLEPSIDLSSFALDRAALAV